MVTQYNPVGGLATRGLCANGEQLVLPLSSHIGRWTIRGSPWSRLLNGLCLIDCAVGVRSTRGGGGGEAGLFRLGIAIFACKTQRV